MTLTFFWSFKDLQVKLSKMDVFYFSTFQNLYLTTNHYSILESLKYNFHILNIIDFNYL